MVTLVKRIGHSTVTVHSPSGVISMNAREQGKWFLHELELGNPVVKQIVDAASEIHSGALSR